MRTLCVIPAHMASSRFPGKPLKPILGLPLILHFHASDPGLAVLGSTGEVDHGAMGRMLGGIGYDGAVSIEQRMVNGDDPLADVARSAQVLRACYGG